VSREDFRRDLRGAFESISGPSSPSLSARVHEALVDAPERRGPVWFAGLAVAVIAVILVGVLFAAGPLSHRQLIPVIPGSSPSPSTKPSPTADASLPAFICSSSTLDGQPLNGPSAAPVKFVDAVRIGTHTGYDRITIEFQNGMPISVEMRPQGNTTFAQGASGQQVKLNGTSGLLATIHGADEHTAYPGTTEFKTGYNGLVEARQVEDFEGVVQWGLGLGGSGCYRAFYMLNPIRLVIDVQTS